MPFTCKKVNSEPVSRTGVHMSAAGRPYRRTRRTQFWVPRSFGRRDGFAGSSHQTPSTTNRYSCSPGSMARVQLHAPSSSRSNGFAVGFHWLKQPATKTSAACGASSLKVAVARFSASCLSRLAAAGFALVVVVFPGWRSFRAVLIPPSIFCMAISF